MVLLGSNEEMIYPKRAERISRIGRRTPLKLYGAERDSKYRPNWYTGTVRAGNYIVLEAKYEAFVKPQDEIKAKSAAKMNQNCS
jgi:hypothetical protein